MEDSVAAASSKGTVDPEDALAAVAQLRQLADRLENDAVERAVESGWTWVEISEALGVTKQAVHKKHSRRLGGRGR